MVSIGNFGAGCNCNYSKHWLIGLPHRRMYALVDDKDILPMTEAVALRH
jgi:hypothetical protein